MGNWEVIWIATLEISPKISRKISQKHNVEISLIRELLICNAEVKGRKIHDKVHGSRYQVYVPTRDDRLLEAHLDLINKNYSAWSVRTARFIAQIPRIGR
jgi:hypothetical protein